MIQEMIIFRPITLKFRIRVVKRFSNNFQNIFFFFLFLDYFPPEYFSNIWKRRREENSRWR